MQVSTASSDAASDAASLDHPMPALSFTAAGSGGSARPSLLTPAVLAALSATPLMPSSAPTAASAVGTQGAAHVHAAAASPMQLVDELNHLLADERHHHLEDQLIHLRSIASPGSSCMLEGGASADMGHPSLHGTNHPATLATAGPSFAAAVAPAPLVLPPQLHQPQQLQDQPMVVMPASALNSLLAQVAAVQQQPAARAARRH